MRVSVGCDPEFFLRLSTKTGNGAWVSAHDMVPGTKAKPHKLGDDGAVQADGTAVEFNITAATSPEEFEKNIRNTLRRIRTMVPKHYDFAFKPAITYLKGYMDTLPDTAKELGCEPDFNAWLEGRANPKPDSTGTMRTGSGHLHIGWTKDANPHDPQHFEDCMAVTRRLDEMFSITVRTWDTDAKRQDLYGKWGTFRPKPYGVEYRVLSNAWLKYPRLWPWLFAVCQGAFRSLEDGVQLRNKQIFTIEQAGAIPHFFHADERHWLYNNKMMKTEVYEANANISRFFHKYMPSMNEGMLKSESI